MEKKWKLKSNWICAQSSFSNFDQLSSVMICLILFRVETHRTNFVIFLGLFLCRSRIWHLFFKAFIPRVELQISKKNFTFGQFSCFAILIFRLFFAKLLHCSLVYIVHDWQLLFSTYFMALPIKKYRYRDLRPVKTCAAVFFQSNVLKTVSSTHYVQMASQQLIFSMCSRKNFFANN